MDVYAVLECLRCGAIRSREQDECWKCGGAESRLEPVLYPARLIDPICLGMLERSSSGPGKLKPIEQTCLNVKALKALRKVGFIEPGLETQVTPITEWGRLQLERCRQACVRGSVSIWSEQTWAILSGTIPVSGTRGLTPDRPAPAVLWPADKPLPEYGR